LEKIPAAAGTTTLIYVQICPSYIWLAKFFVLRQKDTAQNNVKQEHPVHSALTILSISFIKISKFCTAIAGPGR